MTPESRVEGSFAMTGKKETTELSMRMIGSYVSLELTGTKLTGRLIIS